MAEIKILGSASGVPTKNRFCESIAISVDERVYLLDAGEPCSSLLVRAGIPYHRIKAVFISHMHPDHSSGIFMLIQLMQLTGRKSPLKLFVPEEAVDGLSKYLKTVYLFNDLLCFKLEILPIKENGFTYCDKNLSLSAYPNKHLHGLKEKHPHLKLKSYSFLLETEKKKIVYSGDIGKPEDLNLLLEQKIALLISEMAHFKPEELLSYLSQKKIDKIILTHIHPDLDTEEKKLQQIGDKYLGENKVFIAYDGIEVKL